MANKQRSLCCSVYTKWCKLGHNIAVDQSKTTIHHQCAIFYVEHVNRPGYILHVVHHSNYWGEYESE
ncbi:unnamed protein product, partial [Candidula unifasciata]